MGGVSGAAVALALGFPELGGGSGWLGGPIPGGGSGDSCADFWVGGGGLGFRLCGGEAPALEWFLIAS